MPINDVRNTVLAIANKNNYGYISPADFNLYAKQAQMDMFEDYFYQYNNQLVKENLRQSGSGYADITKGLVEVIDSFSATQTLINNGVNLFSLPSNYYLINKINYYPTVILSGTTTAAGTNTLTDATATFTSNTAILGQLVSSVTSGSLTAGQSAYVIAIVSNTELTLSDNIFGVAGTVGNTYTIVSSVGTVEVERVNQNKIFYLNSSPLTSTSTGYPAYVLGSANNTSLGNTVNVYPVTLTTPGTIFAQYVRYPNPPRWTYAQLLGGEPLFDATQADYQDFELPLSDEPILIAKICQYIGVEIREQAVYDFGKAAIAEDNQ